MFPAGILKAFVGLSGSVFTTVYMGAFKPHMLRFLLFLAAAPPVIGAVAVAFVNLVPPHSRPLAPMPGDPRQSLTGTIKRAAGGKLAAALAAVACDIVNHCIDAGCQAIEVW
jgi:Nodulin-like